MRNLARILIVILALSVSALVSVNGQSNPEDDLRDALTDPACQQACYLGMEPGVTTLAEVESILQAQGVYNEPIIGLGPSPIPAGYVFLPPTTYSFIRTDIWLAHVTVYEDAVTQINLPLVIAVDVVIDAFGSPDHVRRSERNSSYTELIYEDEGLVFSVYDNNLGTTQGVFLVNIPGIDGFANSPRTAPVDQTCPNYGAPPCIAPTVIPNQAPVADAGSGYLCHVVAATDTCQFQLDASGSSDPDGTIVAYQWAYRPLGTSDWLPIDPNVTEYTSPTVFFSPTPGDYEVRVRVRDDDFATAEAVTSMEVNIKPQVVTSPALPLCTVDSAGQSCTITLDASATTDPDGTIDRYVWRVQLPDGSRPLQGVTQANDPTWDYTLPSGEHLLYVAAWDNDDGARAVLIDAVANIRPVADAGADQDVYVWPANPRTGASPYSAPITLDGTDSSDPDGIIFTYEWYRIQNNLSTGTETRSSIGNGATLQYNAGVTGCVQTIELVVTDNHGATHADRMLIDVGGDGAVTPPGGCGGSFTP